MTRLKTTCYCGCPMGTEEFEDGKPDFTFREVNAECPLCVASGGEYSKSPYYTDASMEARKLEKEHPSHLPMPADVIPLKGKRIVPRQSASR